MSVAAPDTVVQRSRARRPAMWVTLLATPVLGSVFLLALVGPWIAPHEVGRTVGRPFDPVGVGWLGTETLGRDVWSRVLHGGRRLVIAPVIITVLTTLIGTIVGVAMATSKTASRVLRVIDVVAVMPAVVVLLVMLYRFGGSLVVIAAAIVITSTPYVARYMRAAAMPILNSGYVMQAHLFGDARHLIIRRDVLPNLVGPMFADAALRVSGTFYVVAAAGFLGFGPTSPATDWAAMVNENLPGIKLNVWGVAAPAIAIAAVTVPLNLLGDRLAARWAQA